METIRETLILSWGTSLIIVGGGGGGAGNTTTAGREGGLRRTVFHLYLAFSGSNLYGIKIFDHGNHNTV